MSTPARAGALLLVLAATGLALGAPASGARAAEGDTPGAARLLVTEMTALLGPGTASGRGAGPGEARRDLDLQVVVQNNGGGALVGLRVVVEVYGAARTRSTLRAALDEGRIDTAPLHYRSVAVRDGTAVTPGGAARLNITVDGRQAGWADRGGVYPVRLSVLRGSTVLDEVVTAVVFVANRPAGQLLTTVVWPLTDEPWRLADGSYALDAGGPIGQNGRLDRILGALEEHPDIPVLPAPAAHLLEDLADRADGFVQRTVDGGTRRVGDTSPQAQQAARFLRRLRELAEQLPLSPVASPYAEVDLASLVEGPAPLPALGGGAVGRSRERLTTLAGRAPDSSTVLPRGPLTPGALDLLPGGHLLLDYDDIRAPDLQARPSVDLPPARRTLRSASGRVMQATVADPFVTATLREPDDRHGTAVAVQRTLAESAMKFFQAPEETGRPLLILPPDDWDPPPGFAEKLLAGLSRAPWLRLDRPAADGPGRRAELAPPPVRFSPELLARISRVHDRLRALADALPSSAGVAGRDPDELRDQLLRATSHRFLPPVAAAPPGPGGAAPDPGRSPPAHPRSRRLLQGVAEAVEQAAGSVTIPAGAAVTLTSERGEVPVTIRRDRGAALQIQVTVQSGAGLDWPEGRTQGPMLLSPGASETVSFPVRAVSRGRVPVTVTVTDPTGTLEFGRARLAVRSTTISRPALGLVTGVVVLLLGIAVVRRRRESSRHLEVVR